MQLVSNHTYSTENPFETLHIQDGGGHLEYICLPLKIKKAFIDLRYVFINISYFQLAWSDMIRQLQQEQPTENNNNNLQ